MNYLCLNLPGPMVRCIATPGRRVLKTGSTAQPNLLWQSPFYVADHAAVLVLGVLCRAVQVVKEFCPPASLGVIPEVKGSDISQALGDLMWSPERKKSATRRPTPAEIMRELASVKQVSDPQLLCARFHGVFGHFYLKLLRNMKKRAWRAKQAAKKEAEQELAEGLQSLRASHVEKREKRLEEMRDAYQTSLGNMDEAAQLLLVCLQPLHLRRMSGDDHAATSGWLLADLVTCAATSSEESCQEAAIDDGQPQNEDRVDVLLWHAARTLPEGAGLGVPLSPQQRTDFISSLVDWKEKVPQDVLPQDTQDALNALIHFLNTDVFGCVPHASSCLHPKPFAFVSCT